MVCIATPRLVLEMSEWLFIEKLHLVRTGWLDRIRSIEETRVPRNGRVAVPCEGSLRVPLRGLHRVRGDADGEPARRGVERAGRDLPHRGGVPRAVVSRPHGMQVRSNGARNFMYRGFDDMDTACRDKGSNIEM